MIRLAGSWKSSSPASHRLIADHPMTNKDKINVRFNDFGESSLNILVYFYLETTEYSVELEAREEILLRIMDLANKDSSTLSLPSLRARW